MKKVCLFVIVSAVIMFSTVASEVTFMSFESASEDAKGYIIDALAPAISTADIAIIHSRSDELFRNDGDMDELISLVLNVWASRFAVVLRGKQSIPPYSVGYLYKPERYVPSLLPVPPLTREPLKKDTLARPPYFPSLAPDDNLIRLVFLDRQPTPLKNRLFIRQSGTGDRLNLIYDDAKTMAENDFVKKYELGDIFSNKVYNVIAGCIFQVDYPVPDLPPTALMKLNAAMLASKNSLIPSFQKNSRLIHLTSDEISEIVYIACMFGDPKNGDTYTKLQERNPSILQTMAKPVFKTEIAKRLLVAIETERRATTDLPNGED